MILPYKLRRKPTIHTRRSLSIPLLKVFSQAKQGTSVNGVVGGGFNGCVQAIAFVHGVVLHPQLHLSSDRA